MSLPASNCTGRFQQWASKIDTDPKAPVSAPRLTSMHIRTPGSDGSHRIFKVALHLWPGAPLQQYFLSYPAARLPPTHGTWGLPSSRRGFILTKAKGSRPFGPFALDCRQQMQLLLQSNVHTSDFNPRNYDPARHLRQPLASSRSGLARAVTGRHPST